MDSFFLRAAASVAVPLQLALSVFFLLRGHNEPGGGFIGGLVASSAILLWGISRDFPSARRLMRLDPYWFIGGGLLLAAGAGLAGLVAGVPFLTGLWAGEIPWFPFVGEIKLGTPLYFDIGVYLLVIGVVTRVGFSLERAD